jgi:serine/threonine protein kinase
MLNKELTNLLLDPKFKISQLIFIEMFSQIADAMSYIAHKQIVHGDLDCRNILIFKIDESIPKRNSVKITDFGLSHSLQRIYHSQNSSIIPIRYCALEIFRNNDYSMGVLMWETLSSGEILYAAIPYDQIVDYQVWREISLSNYLDIV